MACTVDKVLSVARGEKGYIEKRDGNLAYLYDKTANAGDKNYTKYGYEMHKIYPEVMDYPAYWCDAYVDWLFYKAYGIANAKGLLGGNFDDYTIASAQLYKNKNAWYQTPKVGDQVFFWNSSKRIHHTGLVIGVDDGHFDTSEGNTSNVTSQVVRNGGAVCEKRYAIGSSSIAGFGRPVYDKQPAFTPHWVHDGEKWYYRIAEGKNTHGWLVVNHHWYYFNDRGEMLTDWQQINGNWYYMQPSGGLEGALYRSDENGAQCIWTVE